MSSIEISPILRSLLARRGVTSDDSIHDFLNPDFEKTCYDPLLFPGVKLAVKRIASARRRREKVVIYGDYDIDGMTATVVLWESLNRFGLQVETYTPDRFTEGYGLNKGAVQKIVNSGARLIITVDNGTLSFDEIDFANSLGVDVIVTDHHTPHETLPNAVAVVNPKILPARFPQFYDQNFCLIDASRADELYPFCDQCGVGTAFVLVRALQNMSLKTATKFVKWEADFAQSSNNFSDKNRLNPYLVPLPRGQEKWLLDLVALGTVCDIVGLVDENRNNVKWGIEVMKRTRRPGIRALLAVSKVDSTEINTETLGFILGPRLNAAGRMETAEYALELLKLHDVVTAGFVRRKLDDMIFENQEEVNSRALALALKLDELNKKRRITQDDIFAQAVAVTDEKFARDSVLVVDGKGWHEGVIGIVAAKLLEKYRKPTFVLARGVEKNIETIDKTTGEKLQKTIGFAKGSGRSFGEFSMASAIHQADPIIERGGGHMAAGGITVRNDKIAAFRKSVQIFYSSLHLENQEKYLIPTPDVTLSDFAKIDENLLNDIATMEPFGHGNEAPIFAFTHIKIVARRVLGRQHNHVKYLLADSNGRQFEAIAFAAAYRFTLEPFDLETGAQNFANITVSLVKNKWNNQVKIEGRLLAMSFAG